jgi:hypothetical protein
MSNHRVVVHLLRPRDFLRTHEGHALLAVARTLAELKRYDFAGCPGLVVPDRAGHGYVVPDETLLAADAARLGIRSAKDVFGGVVPHEFVHTKAITHGLVDDDAERPSGWSARFAARVGGVVLPGYTAFSRRDARHGASMLLSDGPIRIKRPLAAGGRGQAVVSTLAELEGFLGAVPDDELPRAGIVMETNLDKVRTVSVGQVALDDLVVSYHGEQQLTTNNAGQVVYGGSDLECVRGGWDELERVVQQPALRQAVAQARRYDEATEEYQGLIVSRHNYDVVQGVDSRGRWRSAVLEQGWRAGGASGAEVLALAALARDPGLTRVSASTVERYGDGLEPPAGAVVHFTGVDPVAGPMVRYATTSTAILARAA